MEYTAHDNPTDFDESARPLLERADDTGRAVTGVFTLMSPLAVIAALVVGTVHSMGGVAASPVWGPLAMALLIYSIIWTGLLLLFYAPHLLASRWIGETSKKLWALSFLFAAPIALPFYFVAHVWRDRGPFHGPDEKHPYAQPRNVHVTELPLS